MDRSNLKVSVHHSLSQHEALRRVKAWAARLSAEYSDRAKIAQNWDTSGGAFRVAGANQDVTGTVMVKSPEVTIELILSPFLLAFKRVIEPKIREALTKILDKPASRI